MPPQTSQSNFLARVGNRLDQAVKAHAKDEVDMGFQRLPAPIPNGIAKLTEIGFFEYKQGSNMKKADGSSAVGEYYFRASGVVVSPKSIATTDGIVPVAGKSTSIMIPVIDTKTQDGKVTTAAEHLTSAKPNVLNELRKLGATINPSQGLAQLVAICAALKKQGMYFHFSTSPRQPRPGTRDTGGIWENWNGVEGLGDYTPPEDRDGDDDSSPLVGEQNGQAQHGVGYGEYTDQDDVSSLLERANQKGTDAKAAQDRLIELAVAAGVSRKDAIAADSWEEVAEMAAGASDGGAEGEAEEGREGEEVGETTPTKDTVYKFRPMVKGPGGKLVQAKKAVEVLCTSVNESKKTVNLKNNDDGKTVYKDVAWDRLEEFA